MLPIKLENIARIVGAPETGLPDETACGVSIDTRTLEAGEVFFAIEGRRFDGHDYVVEALERGACAAVVKSSWRASEKYDERRLLRVADATRALGAFARHCRKASDAVFIAVTGSNGQTTVKDMIHHLISARMKTAKSPKSFNNFVGVPLTLLGVEPDDRAVVVEIGTNAPGEIAYLASLVLPHIGVLTNVGMTHLAGLKSMAGVAEEKASLLSALPEDGLAVLNSAEPFFEVFRTMPRESVVWWGLEGEADYRATEIEQHGETVTYYLNGQERIELGCPGRHNVANSLAAIAVARRVGVGLEEIRGALRTFRLPQMRLQREDAAGVCIINDAYNANPHSVGAAISVLDGTPCEGRKILVLGEMAELGEQSRESHRSIGKVVRASGVDMLVAVGGDACFIHESAAGGKLKSHYCEGNAEALAKLRTFVEPGDAVLFKASREVRLEELIDSLRQHLIGRRTDALCPFA